MDVLYSHATALSLIREHAGDSELARSTRPVLAPARTPSCELAAAEGDEPTNTLVSSQAARMAHPRLRTHLHVRPLPSGAVLSVGPALGRRERLRVCSPEVVFIQLAGSLRPAELVLLGYELCGSYSVRPSSGELVEREPLTTPVRLANMIGRCTGMHGVRSARRALRHVLPGSASPFESILSMLAHLPPSLGGYGLGVPELNPVLAVPSATRAITSQRTVSPDELFAECDEAIEYESDEYHLDSEKHTRDSHRRSVLAHMGIHVTTITRGQIFDVDMFDAAMWGLARSMGRRLRVGSPEWKAARRQLRKTLLDPYRSEQREAAELQRHMAGADDAWGGNEAPALPPDWRDLERGAAEEAHDASAMEEAEFWRSVE